MVNERIQFMKSQIMKYLILILCVIGISFATGAIQSVVGFEKAKQSYAESEYEYENGLSKSTQFYEYRRWYHGFSLGYEIELAIRKGLSEIPVPVVFSIFFISFYDAVRYKNRASIILAVLFGILSFACLLLLLYIYLLSA